ncbi:MAG: copper resistance protein NlpE N-terminal domain-containing protein [Neisseriaceae bacterium]|nr:copper resistance protein NlpE N-terminal domain-containing protein [Neisseriaceae bacterium]
MLLRSFCIFLLSFLIACNQNVAQKNTASAVEMQNSKTWTGIYYGELPCADCNRIELEIKLSPDFTYQMKTQKVGSLQFPPQIVRGKFKWRLDGNGLIQLDENGDNMVFFVGKDGKLEMRGNDGKAYPNHKGEICHLNKLVEQK